MKSSDVRFDDDYYIRLHYAREYFLAYRLRGNAWKVGLHLIDLCLRYRNIGLWSPGENEVADAFYLKPRAFRQALRKLEALNVIKRDKWPGLIWYEVRPHREWCDVMSGRRWWRWARATIRLTKGNPATIAAFRSEWPEIAGKKAQLHSAPARIIGRVLHVACDSSAWRDRLDEEPLRRLLTRRLRVRFGGISRIKFVIEPLPATQNIYNN